MNKTFVQERTRIEIAHAYSDVQSTALDLYERGLNVIPLQRHKKKPFILAPFFTARLHHCNAECRHAGIDDITELFTRRNIGLVMGRTSGNLFALDCDSQQSFKQIGQELIKRAIPFWAITGNRGGAYLLRLIEGEAANADKSNCEDVQIWGNRHMVVIPPSIHPSGVLYQWATPEPRFCLPPRETIPAVSVIALEWLGVRLDLESRKQWQEPELFGLPQWAAALSYDNRQTFSRELSEGERNTRLFALACDIAGNDRPYHEAEALVLDAARRNGLSDCEAVQIVKNAYSQQREPARKEGGGVRLWQRAEQFASVFNWREVFGRKANTRRAIFLACVERARCEGRDIWRATVRELAELANMNKDGVPACLLDLVNAGLIERVETSERIGIYRFGDTSKNRTLYTTGSCSVRNLDYPKIPKKQAEQDAFGKLGIVAWYVWKHLLETPSKSAHEIAKSTGMARSSVYGALKRLQSAGLATRAGDGLVYGEAKTDASLQSMALSWSDGESKSAQRKERHKIERERRVNYLVQRAIERMETQ